MTSMLASMSCHSVLK